MKFINSKIVNPAKKYSELYSRGSRCYYSFNQFTGVQDIQAKTIIAAKQNTGIGKRKAIDDYRSIVERTGR